MRQDTSQNVLMFPKGGAQISPSINTLALISPTMTTGKDVESGYCQLLELRTLDEL